MAKQRSWEKRLTSEPDKLTVDFVESLSYDRRLYKYDIVGSIAHARMLAEQRLITKSEFKAIEKGLYEIADEIAAGRFKFDKKHEDIHMAIEAALIKNIGQAGEKLHTGRSRNDQVATDIRLWARDQTEILHKGITCLQKAFVKLASKHTDDLMPAYTHLQRAQPIVIAAYLLSFVEQLERDCIRLDNCRTLLNISPLGSGAIAGSTLPLDRRATAGQLGFADIARNSIDAVGDRDFVAELIFDCAMIATHLSRLAEDWTIFSSNEFQFITIDDRFCTSSSMMPQKRNPDVLELIRSSTAGVYGSLMAILTILKGQPTGYNRDLQQDKVHLFAASDTVQACLNMAQAVAANTTFNVDNINIGLRKGFPDATAMAEYLVRKGVPFRTAHGLVGSMVAHCEKACKQLAEMTLHELRGFCPSIGADVFEYLGPENVVRRYATEGAGGPRQAKEQIAFWKRRLERR